MIISQKFGNNLWTLDLMLEYINEELQAKERCASFHKSVEEQRPQKKNLYFTATNLHTQQEQSQQQKGRCVFCLKNDHPPSQCKQVTNIKSPVDILRKYAKCFKCLKPGHLARNCTSSYVCRKCNKVEERRSDISDIVTQVNVTVHILLQTAKAELKNTFSSEKVWSRLMFDSGSQRSYVSSKVREKLKLKTLRTEKIIIKTFGNDDSKLQTLELVQF